MRTHPARPCACAPRAASSSCSLRDHARSPSRVIPTLFVMTNIVPREVVTPGILSKVGVIGRIVRMRTRNINEINTGKGGKGGRDVSFAKGKNKRKADGPLCVLELHISGGTTAADVIMFEV